MAMILGIFPPIAKASSWSPTLLVNTESFEIIDDGSGSTNIELRFGDSANEILRWDISNARFQFTDDVHVEGNITGSGTLTVDGAVKTKGDITLNSDQSAADTVLTFGSDTTNETLKFLNNEDRFEVSDDLRATGEIYASGALIVDGAATFKSTVKLNGVTYTFPVADGSNGYVLTTNAAGTLSWSSKTEGSVTQADGDARYVNQSGDTMTGALSIKKTSGTSTGNTLVVDTKGLVYDATNKRVGIGDAAPSNELEVRGTVSGSSLHANSLLTSSGNVLAAGNITVNSDNGAADAVLTFGNDAGAETITFNDATNEFDISDDVNVTGTFDATSTITTNANLTINADNGAADAVLTFGSDGTAETATFANATDRFDFSDDIHTTGNLTASGTLTIQGATVLKSTLKLNGVIYTFPTSDGSASGKVLKTNSAGQLSWSADIDTNTNAQTICATDEYLDGDGNCVDVIEEAEMDSMAELETQVGGANVIVSTEIDSESELETLLSDVSNVYTNNDGVLFVESSADARYVNVSGDTMTGSLRIANNGILNVSGAILGNGNLTINSDNGAADAILTFGSDTTAETLTFANTSDRFEFSDDVYATGVVRAHGGLSGASLRVDGGSVSINGVAYSFTNTDGSVGQVLRTDGAGNLTWSSLANGSGNTVFLSPEYPNAVYFASGSSFIGQLYASGGNLTNLDNSYAWSSTNASIQDYWVSTRVKIPHNFSTWAPTPIQFRYKTGTATAGQNHLTVKFFDTAGTQIALTNGGGLASTSWTTANITGPQGSGTYTPDSYITIMVKLAANNTASAKAHAGSISLNWRTTTP